MFSPPLPFPFPIFRFYFSTTQRMCFVDILFIYLKVHILLKIAVRLKVFFLRLINLKFVFSILILNCSRGVGNTAEVCVSGTCAHQNTENTTYKIVYAYMKYTYIVVTKPSLCPEFEQEHQASPKENKGDCRHWLHCCEPQLHPLVVTVWCLRTGPMEMLSLQSQAKSFVL